MDRMFYRFTQIYGMGKVIELGSAKQYNDKAKILFKRSYIEKCRKSCFKEYFFNLDIFSMKKNPRSRSPKTPRWEPAGTTRESIAKICLKTVPAPSPMSTGSSLMVPPRPFRSFVIRRPREGAGLCFWTMKIKNKEKTINYLSRKTPIPPKFWTRMPLKSLSDPSFTVGKPKN